MKNKKNIHVIIIVSIAALIISGCTAGVGAASSWPGFSVTEKTGFLSFGAQTYAVDLKNGSLVWKYPAEADRARQAYSAPETADGITVFGDYSGSLVAVNSVNGTKKWEFTGAEDRYIASASITNGIVYAPNTDGYLYVLDNEGSLKWKFLAEGPNWTKPVSNAEFVYMASMDHSIYALSQDIDTASLELAKDGSKTLRTDVKWATDLGMAIVADPVLEDGVIYVATIEGKLYALDANSGAILWSFNNGGDLGSIWGTPVLDETIIFFADINGNVYTVEKETGKQHWPSPFSAGGKIVGGGALTADGIIFATDAGKLFRINSEKEPKTISSYENAIYSSIKTDGENILIAPVGEKGLLSAIDPEGFEVWSFAPSEK